PCCSPLISPVKRSPFLITTTSSFRLANSGDTSPSARNAAASAANKRPINKTALIGSFYRVDAQFRLPPMALATRCLTAVDLCLRCFPFPHSVPRFVEKALVICFANLLVCFFAQQLPQWLVLVIDTQIVPLFSRSHFVCAEQEAVGVTVDQVGRDLYG